MSERTLTRRNLLQGAALLTVGTVIAACAPKVQDTAVQPKEAEKVAEQPVAAPKEKIVLRFGKFAGEGWMHDEIWSKKFDDENPDITVTLEDVIYGEMQTKCLTLAATGMVWDVFSGHSRWKPYLAYSGLTLELDSFIEAKREEIDFDDFFPSVLDDARTFTENTIHWFPTVVHPGGNAIIGFNMDLMDEAGVDLPESVFAGDWDVHDYEEIIRRAATPGDIFGTSISVGSTLYGSQYARSWGTDPEQGSDDAWLLSRDGMTHQLGDEWPLVKAAYEWYHQLIVDRYTPSMAEAASLVGTNHFLAGIAISRASEISGPRSFHGQIGDRFRVRYAPFPKGPYGHRGSALSYNTQSVYSETKHPEEAASLAAYLTGKEPALWTGTEGHLMCFARRSAWFSPELLDAEPYGEIMRFAANWFESGVDPYPHPWNLRGPELQTTFSNNIAEYLDGIESWNTMAPRTNDACQAIIDFPRP